jgi:undecaprenyl diphosphate synthase
VEAAKSISESGEEITEESFGKHLWTAGMPPHQSECPKCGKKANEYTKQSCYWCGGMPDPDIIIRTGGEKRLSNFLLWQGAYAEIFFVDPYWPDFSEEILDGILKEYGERERRHGK